MTAIIPDYHIERIHNQHVRVPKGGVLLTAEGAEYCYTGNLMEIGSCFVHTHEPSITIEFLALEPRDETLYVHSIREVEDVYSPFEAFTHDYSYRVMEHGNIVQKSRKTELNRYMIAYTNYDDALVAFLAYQTEHMPKPGEHPVP